jgi:hypothetical protein
VGYFRLFYKADQSEVVGFAPTRAGLPLQADKCGASCLAIPRGVGVNPYRRVLVNGVPTTAAYGATLGGVILAAKRRPEEVLPTLGIAKPFGGRLVEIEFDRTKQEILGLVLTGDEQIRW